MADHVYGSMQITGSSPEGSDQAIRNAVAKAQTLVSNLRWFEVVETRGHIDNGTIAHWQVTIRLGHTLD
ncbi:MAG: dodecin [Planctomycetota bacterium]